MKNGESAKEEVLLREGDAYFRRNLDECDTKIAKGCKLLDVFLSENICKDTTLKILEVGCCYGQNLMYLSEKYRIEGYGIEPSKEAVDYGKDLFRKTWGGNVILQQGTADELPFETEFFDIVILAFCMFWVDRSCLMRSAAEADRVLKTGGILVTWDFDTKIPYKRANSHNINVPTYKCDLSNMFLWNPQYCLVEKRSYSHDGYIFHKAVQERCALNILYKDEIDDAYVFA